MNVQNFKLEENKRLLWEIIIDENNIKNKIEKRGEPYIQNIVFKFKSKFDIFCKNNFENENNLLELNKKFIRDIITELMNENNITQNVTKQLTPSPYYKKIKIHDTEPLKELITYEEIKNDKIKVFENEFNKKKDEFKLAISLPTPPTPKFKDDITDKPISQIELEIQKIKEQRNYDIEMINIRDQNNDNKQLTNDWLKTHNTNIKYENLGPINETQDTFSLNKKNITWANPITDDNDANYTNYINDTSDINEINIFNKLKIINNEEESNNQTNQTNQINQMNQMKEELYSLNKKFEYLNTKIDSIISKMSQ